MTLEGGKGGGIYDILELLLCWISWMAQDWEAGLDMTNASNSSNGPPGACCPSHAVKPLISILNVVLVGSVLLQPQLNPSQGYTYILSHKIYTKSEGKIIYRSVKIFYKFRI